MQHVQWPIGCGTEDCVVVAVVVVVVVVVAAAAVVSNIRPTLLLAGGIVSHACVGYSLQRQVLNRTNAQTVCVRTVSTGTGTTTVDSASIASGLNGRVKNRPRV